MISLSIAFQCVLAAIVHRVGREIGNYITFFVSAQIIRSPFLLDQIDETTTIQNHRIENLKFNFNENSTVRNTVLFAMTNK